MYIFFRRLWHFARPYRLRLALGLLCGILYGLANGALMFVVKLVVNLVFVKPEGISVIQELAKVRPAFLRKVAESLAERMPILHSPSSKLGIVLAISAIPAVMLARGICSYLNVYLMSWSAMRAVADLRTRLFDHLQNLSLSFFNQARTGDLISRTISDTNVLYTVIGSSVASIVKDPVTVVVLLGVMLSIEPGLTLISMLVLPVCLVPITIYARKARKSARQMQGHVSELTNLMHEAFTGNRVIKAYNLESKVLSQFVQTTRKFVNQRMRVIRANEIPSQLTEFMGAIGVALVLLYVAFLSGRSASTGGFVAFILSIVVMYQPIKALTRLHNQLHQAEAASHRVFELLETSTTVVEPSNPMPLRAKGADIHFRNIDFAYGDRAVLQGINFTVRSGQMLAVVGSSGSGKTTLVNLLLRFYDPQRGAVQIGSTDIRDVAIRDLRGQIALVAQETILFNDTIRSNIALGRPSATVAEIEAAARNAYAHDFILQQPQGYDTIVGEKGAALSGGQRQRIAIARALLKDAPILVLDEAMSALDSESERAVQSALERLMLGRTTLCIAHKFTTIQRADLIIVLEGGRIVETGRHAQLIQARGIYWKLHELQFDTAAPDITPLELVSVREQ